MQKYNAKPFVKWVGGKTQLLKELKNRLPENFSELQNLRYIEPFVGGGAVLFWILQEYKNIKSAIINDINEDLTLAYRTVKQSPELLIQELKRIETEYIHLNELARKEYYLKMRDLFNAKQLDSVLNTAIFIFLNRTCFNGLYRVNKKGLFNVPFGRYSNPKICDEVTLYADSELLQRVEILTGDFSQTFDYANENSFFYFDPPYKPISLTSSFNSYTKEGFDDNEQLRLRDFCNQISDMKCNFILSNSDVQPTDSKIGFFDELYSLYSINRVAASRMINSNSSSRGKVPEILVFNL